MPSKKNYSVDGASARDIDELVRKHASDTTGEGTSNDEEMSSQYAKFFVFAAVATALPVFIFTTPIFQMSPAEQSVQFAGTALGSILLLVMSYAEAASKIMRGLSGKKRVNVQLHTILAAQASSTAIFHMNALYAILSLVNSLYLLPLYGASESLNMTASVGGSALLVLLLAKLF